MVDFNASFGYNIKNYQQLKRMNFGSALRGANFQQNQLYSMNTSLFKLDGNLGSQNIFKTNQTQSFSFNGVNYDNAFEMLNSVNGEGGKSSFKDSVMGFVQKTGDFFEGAAKKVGDFGKKVGNAVKNGINKLFGKKDANKTNNVSKSLDDIKKAQDKETLNQALGGAKAEQAANVKEQQSAEKNSKAAEKQSQKTDKAAEKAEQQVDKNKEQLDNDKSALEESKQGVSDAQKRLDQAKQGVSDAESNLQAAKNAATQENPNTAAIQQAEAELRTAKQEEEAAKQELDAAKQKESECQTKVDNSTQELSKSEADSKQAQEEAKLSQEEMETSKQAVKTTQEQGKEIDTGIEEGNQKLEQMENAEMTNGAQPAMNSDGTPVNTDLNTQNNPSVSENPQSNVYENNGQYYVNGFQTDQNMYNAAQNMDPDVVNAGFVPGSTTDVYVNGQDNPTTFTVQNGQYMVNGQEVDSKTFMNEYNNAKANEEAGTGGDISLINDDYSKYKNADAGNKDSGTVIGKNTTGSASTRTTSNQSTGRPPANESGNGQVDQEFASKNRAREDAEWAAYVASRKAK